MKMKEHANGGMPPQHLPVFQVGRFQLVHTLPGKVWLRDTQSGDGGAYDISHVEAALEELHRREF